MKFYYSPFTGEKINTDTPSDWMSVTEIEPTLEYDPLKTSLFFNEDINEWYVKEPEIVKEYKTIFSVREFRNRFTLEEQIAIRQASMTDMQVGLVYDEFQSAQYIDLNDPAVEQGLSLYVDKNLITEARKIELLKQEEIINGQ